MFDPAFTEAGVQRPEPEGGSIRAEILHEAPQTILDLPIDLRGRTRGELLREIAQERLELQALGQASLSSSALRTLDEQRHDERALEEQQHDRGEDVFPVPFPHGRLMKEHHASGGNQATVDPPPLDLTLVEHGN